MANIDPFLTEPRILERAHLLWEKAGKPAGGAELYHAEAKRQLVAMADEEASSMKRARTADALPTEPRSTRPFSPQ